jgi:transposase
VSADQADWIAEILAECYPAAVQCERLAWIAKTDPRLHRAYLLKEGLRFVFQVKGEAGKQALDRWLSWARRCRIPAFVHLAKRITAIRDKTHAALDHALSNALIESVNTKIRLLTRITRVPLIRRPHRPGHAQPRRPQARPPRPDQPTDRSLEPEILGPDD